MVVRLRAIQERAIEDGVLALIHALNDDYWNVRFMTASALGFTGEGAEDAVPALILSIEGSESVGS